MLVNLTPVNNFRSMEEKHNRHMNKHWRLYDEKHKPRKFTDLFTPTEYTGVFWCDGSHNMINAWSKQHIVYDTKGFRNRQSKISKENIDEYIAQDLNAWTYGVADNLEQIIQFYNTNTQGYFKGNHVILVFKVRRDQSAPCSGWRWHKWGEYIGTQNPQCEYLNDEPEIEEVICFSILKVI